MAQTHTPSYDVPVPQSFKLLAQPWDAQIIEDFRNPPLAQVSLAFQTGMVTVLSAPIRFGGRTRVAVNFFSRQTGWFRREEVPIAERIAGHIALVMLHDSRRGPSAAGTRRYVHAIISRDQGTKAMTVPCCILTTDLSIPAGIFLAGLALVLMYFVVKRLH